MLTDREYQTLAVDSVWEYFAKHSGNPVIAMPTGTGKSVVIARILQRAYTGWPQQKTLILTHVKELIQQNYEKLLMAWPFAPAGVCSAGLGVRDLNKAITFAGIASIYKLAKQLGKIDLIIIDEGHLVSPNQETMYRKLINELIEINPMLKVITLTATHWRLGQGLITEDHVNRAGKVTKSIFTDICFDMTTVEAFNWLIAQGYLVPLIPRNTETILDVTGVHMQGGEFKENELQIAVNRDDITEAALREAIQMGANRHRWLVFASGIEHTEAVTDMLNYLGVSADCVHSKKEGRDETLRKHKRGEIRALVNSDILTTGYDDPEIDMIIVLRPTASSGLWVQLLGRGTRPLFAPGFDLNTQAGRLAAIAASGKHNCLVLDFAANTGRLGPINDPIIPNPKGKKAGPAPVKVCPGCNHWVHASIRFCIEVIDEGVRAGEVCGHEFLFQTKLKTNASDKELIKQNQQEMPIVEIMKVDYLTVSRHEKLGAKPMAKVSYYCGLQVFDRYLGFGRGDFTERKAKEWWRMRSSETCPATLNEALDGIPETAVPTHIRVWVNTKYPEILAECFDGSAFNTQDPAELDYTPTYESGGAARQVGKYFSKDLDDDIPF